jgi:hypothetical protein
VRKFQSPILRLVTTADGPVCFDMTKESEQVLKKDDPLNFGVVSVVGSANVPFCQCQCTCECMAPCTCQCTCECTAPCNCQCTCECTGKGDVSCAALTVENDPIVEIINPIERTGEKIVLNQSFMFRKEKFGGLLFDKQNFVSYYCNDTAWEIFQFIERQKGLQLRDIKVLSDHIRDSFQEVPKDLNVLILAFVHGCLKKSSRKVRS